jgi:predicted dehydrogenase
MNFLIIGFGSVGKRHAQNLRELGISCLIVEPNMKKHTEAINDGYVAFNDLNQIGSNYSFDAVLICSPPAFHIEQAAWALEKDKTVFLEKPVGLNLKESKKLLSYDHSKVFVGYTYHWNPQFLKLKSSIESDLVGKPYYASFNIGMNLEDWHPWENYRNFFMSSYKLGGGALLDESHFIELAIDLFGLPKKIFSTQTKISNLEIETDDYVFAQFQYHELIVDVKLDLFKRPHESHIQIHGSAGSINCDFIEKTNSLITSTTYANYRLHSETFVYERNEVFKNMMIDFSSFVSSQNKIAKVSFLRGLEVMFLIDKIRKGSMKKNWITVGVP